MFSSFAGWLLSVVLAFFAGASVGNSDKPADSELQQKVQDHMDVIVDETAGIIDDVSDEIRNNEHVKEAEAFVDDVKEIAQNTADDIEAHFGSKDDTEESADEMQEGDEAVEESTEA